MSQQSPSPKNKINKIGRNLVLAGLIINVAAITLSSFASGYNKLAYYGPITLVVIGAITFGCGVVLLKDYHSRSVFGWVKMIILGLFSTILLFAFMLLIGFILGSNTTD